MVKQSRTSAPKRKARIAKFSVDCSIPVADNILTSVSVEKFLHDRIKVDGKTGQLGDEVRITRTERNVILSCKLPFSKRYIKYLMKKYLKKQQLRDYLRVVSVSPLAYQLRYFPDGGNDEEEEEES